jgi:hypothetical protein
MCKRAATAAGFVVTAGVIARGRLRQCWLGHTQQDRGGDVGPRPLQTPLGAGEFIAFEREVAGAEDHDLYAVGAEGREPSLVRSPGDYPHWSPDGSVLAFNRSDRLSNPRLAAALSGC